MNWKAYFAYFRKLLSEPTQEDQDKQLHEMATLCGLPLGAIKIFDQRLMALVDQHAGYLPAKLNNDEPAIRKVVGDCLSAFEVEFKELGLL